MRSPHRWPPLLPTAPFRHAARRAHRLGLKVAVIATPICGGLSAQAPTSGPTPAEDSSVVQWARQHAIALPPIDAPYADSGFAFLPRLVGNARIIAFGEYVHNGRQPLTLRNKLIRYAVTHLGMTGVAIESSFTESEIVDRYIQGDPGNIDSVLHAGITWQFDSLPQNRDLIQWLREHNSHAARKVHFYGMDITGANDVGMMPGAGKAILAALAFGDRVAPTRVAPMKAELVPLLDRFMPDRYAEYTAADRDRLRTVLDSLHQLLQQDSTHGVHATSPREYARAVRNAWEAQRLNDLMALGAGMGKPDGMIRAGVTFRDSLMAENATWALEQEGHAGRLFVFAHDGHVMDTQAVLDSTVARLLGFRLRARYGKDVVIVASMADTLIGGAGTAGGWIRGSEVVPADPASFAAALSKVGPPLFILDMRTVDESPAAAAAVSRPWPLLMAGFTIPIVPRQTFDAVVYIDRITPTDLLH